MRRRQALITMYTLLEDELHDAQRVHETAVFASARELAHERIVNIRTALAETHTRIILLDESHAFAERN